MAFTGAMCIESSVDPCSPLWHSSMDKEGRGYSVKSWGRICSIMVTENNFDWCEKSQAHLVGNFDFISQTLSSSVYTTQINL